MYRHRLNFLPTTAEVWGQVLIVVPWLCIPVYTIDCIHGKETGYASSSQLVTADWLGCGLLPLTNQVLFENEIPVDVDLSLLNFEISVTGLAAASVNLFYNHL